MAYSTAADMKYIDDLASIPRAPLPDPFTDSDKLSAAQEAEEKVEADINSGERINDIQPLHSRAAITWASYILVSAAKAPEATFSGDFEDDGGDRNRIADRLKSDYNELLASINASEKDSTGGTSSVFSVPDSR